MVHTGLVYTSRPRDAGELRARLVAMVKDDARVLGLIDYGSASEGRNDRWSDVDCALYVDPLQVEAFRVGWAAWIARIGPVLLWFVGDIGNHWSVVDGLEFPIRIDVTISPADPEHISRIATLPNAPVTVEAMLLVDKTGDLRTPVASIVGQSLAPVDMPDRVDLVIAGFWYYAVRTWCKLQRGPTWGVRFDITFMMHGNLMAILRLEAGKIARWRASDAAARIEDDIAPERLAALDRCIPGPEPDELRRALGAIVRLGAEASEGAAARYGRTWPRDLAQRMVEHCT